MPGLTNQTPFLIGLLSLPCPIHSQGTRMLKISHLSAGSRESVLQLAQTRFDHQTAISQDMTVLIGSGGVSALALNAWILCLSVDAPLY